MVNNMTDSKEITRYDYTQEESTRNNNQNLYHLNIPRFINHEHGSIEIPKTKDLIKHFNEYRASDIRELPDYDVTRLISLLYKKREQFDFKMPRLFKRIGKKISGPNDYWEDPSMDNYRTTYDRNVLYKLMIRLEDTKWYMIYRSEVNIICHAKPLLERIELLVNQIDYYKDKHMNKYLIKSLNDCCLELDLFNKAADLQYYAKGLNLRFISIPEKAKATFKCIKFRKYFKKLNNRYENRKLLSY